MVNVEAELSKHKNCRDRDELTRIIKDYKNLALQHASDMFAAGQYNTVARKLQEICDKLPITHRKGLGGSSQSTPVKTATITDEEHSKIDSAWNKKTKS